MQRCISCAWPFPRHAAHVLPDRERDARGPEEHENYARTSARQVTVGDFRRFDLILAMDAQNLRDLQAIRPADATARLELLDPDGVPDPYYDGPEAFAAIYTQIDRCCRKLAQAP